MKTIRKVLAALISVAMLMAFALPAGAAGPTTYSITIKNSTAGHTYEAYQIFAGDFASGKLSNVTWGTGVDSSALLTALVADTTIGTKFAATNTAADVAKTISDATFKEAEVKAFAQVVGQHLASTATATATVADGATSCVINITNAGYYLVKDKADSQDDKASAYTSFILKVAGAETVEPKSSVPAVEKKVQENAKTPGYEADSLGLTQTDKWNDVADYNIGDLVPFKLIGTLPTNYEVYTTYKYVFTDTTSAGLDIEAASIKVYKDSIADANLIDAAKYATSIAADKHSMTVTFDNLKSVAGLTSANKIIVAYTAKLNSGAVIGLGGNENKVQLTYSNNPNQGGAGDTGKTTEDKVIVFTYELDTTKVDAQNTNTKLEKAEFVLYKEVGGTKTYATVAADKVTGWTTTEGDATTLVSDANGLFKVAGLDDGTYYLKETKAPAGYNKLADPVKIVITATTTNNQSWTGTASDALTKLEISVKGATAVEGDKSTGVVKATIANNTGAVLPSTGGIGTTLFYVIGGLLMAGAAVLLITKKRMSGKND